MQQADFDNAFGRHCSTRHYNIRQYMSYKIVSCQACEKKTLDTLRRTLLTFTWHGPAPGLRESPRESQDRAAGGTEMPVASTGTNRHPCHEYTSLPPPQTRPPLSKTLDRPAPWPVRDGTSGLTTPPTSRSLAFRQPATHPRARQNPRNNPPDPKRNARGSSTHARRHR
jgi:hypothetical protein